MTRTRVESNRSTTSWRVLLALFAVFALVLAACGGDDDDAAGDDDTEVTEPDDLSGEVVVSGSSTVEPISALVGELFAGEYPDVAVRVDGPGTGDGFQLFCAGETDIADASRPIKDNEKADCDAAGIEYVEIPIAIDGLSVIGHPDEEAECLSFAQLYALVGPESEGINNWSDANALATELGGEGNLPDQDLKITAPGEESGTYDSFIDIALSGIAKERVTAGKITADQEKTTRKDYSSQANDNTIIEGIAADKGSLGWVGYAFADENRDQVKLLQVDAGEGCIEPTPETIVDGSYPLARTLYIYVNTAKAAENPAVKAYVDYYLTDDGNQAVADADYIQLPADRWSASTDIWAGAAVDK